MDLNYDLADKSETLRKMNHFEKFSKANKNFIMQICYIFRVLCAYFGVKDWMEIL